MAHTAAPCVSKRGLRIARRHQLIVGTLEAEPRERNAERRVGLLEDGRGRWESGGEILSHPRLLRSLPGKEQYDIHANVC